jgi:RNA polymerase primary sigma factor
MEDPETIEPDDRASQTLLREKLIQALSALGDREQKVLSMRFGIKDGRRQSLEEIGQFFGVTSERIRRIEKRALRKMRHSSSNTDLRKHL